ncbi:hypothetical protein KY385_00745 [Candidatus Parcubacteria bacterium]|nr:hypothetical protein [Candidatus Parcubacteria bacterium]
MKKGRENPNFDVEKRQNSLFDASVRNTLLANESITLVQNSMLALGLAELAFLGVILIDNDRRGFFVKLLILLLIASFVLFLLGQIRQYKHQLITARSFEAKANKALEYLAKGNQYLDHEPEEISTKKQQIVSDKIANIFIFSSLIVILLVTAGTVWLVITI